MKELHLICNSHIDPCWQWDVEEGIAAALSTFRCAADFCEEYDGLIFNHNEALIYEWIEKYDHALFQRILKLAAEGKWHIMGGWYLQPDCNLSGGESLIRQILKGRLYFKEKFNVWPTAAMNVDSFGHSRGLVQILKKSGFDSYIFSRPFEKDMHLPQEDFIWEGYDGSKIQGFRLFSIYNSLYGQACKKIKGWVEKNPDKKVGCLFWGVGDHGGGPSRVDLDEIDSFARSVKEEMTIMHSYPEQYFARLDQEESLRPVISKGLNHWGPGTYTSISTIKQLHRRLENEYYRTEKIATHAAICAGKNYPRDEMDKALRELLFVEFHDILPGSCVPSAEETGIRKAQYAEELLRKITFDAFLTLCIGQKSGSENRIPIFVYNPHPYEVEGIFECEFMLANMNVSGTFMNPVVYRDGTRLPSQCEKEESNFPMDWRKKVVFSAILKPSQMNRFECAVEELESEISRNGLTSQAIADGFLNPDKKLQFESKNIRFPVRLPLGKPLLEYNTENSCVTVENESIRAIISEENGLIKSLAYMNNNLIGEITPTVILDNIDSWGANILNFPDELGPFTINRLKNQGVQVVENGEVRMVVDSHLSFEKSEMLVRYSIPRKGNRIQVDIRVNWAESDRMIKVKIPFTMDNAKCFAQMPYGSEEVLMDGHEAYMQQWCAVVNDSFALSVINEGVYGFSCDRNSLNLTLLRSPAYAAHPAPVPGIECEADYRDIPRMDQGLHHFRFWIEIGSAKQFQSGINRHAQSLNEKPIILSLYPQENGIPIDSLVELVGTENVLLTTFKPREIGKGYVLRLFESAGEKSSVLVKIPHLNVETAIQLDPFEIATFICDYNKMEKCTMMENIEYENANSQTK